MHFFECLRLSNTGRVQKKVPLSRRFPPETGSGRINAPHGGRYLYVLPGGHKKGQSGKGWRTSRRLSQMESTANIGIVFEYAIKKAEVFLLPPTKLFYRIHVFIIQF